VSKGIIEAHRSTSKKRGYEPTTYRLRFAATQPLSRNRTRGGQKNGQGLVQKSDIQTTEGQTTDINTVNGVVKGGEKSSLPKLPDLGEPPEKTEYVAKQILKELGDEKSSRFYGLVAAKIPEHVIREVLSEVRVDGARSPAKLFTYKIQRYALAHQKQ
jgi:hypothetical protein